MHVLILGARAPVALEWARIAKYNGCTVTVADSLYFPLSRFSSQIDHYLALPSPRHQLKNWTTIIKDYVQTKAINMVIPTCEEAFYLAHQKEQLQGITNLFVSDFTMMRTLHHKGDFATLTHSLGIRAPSTTLLTSHEALNQVLKEQDLHSIVLKPVYSRFASATLIRPTLTMCQKIKTISPDYPWIMQTFIEGTEYCSYSLFHQGNVTAHSCYQPLYRAGKGAGIYFEPKQLSAITEFVHQFGQMTQYTGQAAFDFICDRNGKNWVLECNPRASSGLHLFRQQKEEIFTALITPEQSCIYADITSPLTFKLAMSMVALPKSLGNLPKWWHDYHRAENIMNYPSDQKPRFSQGLSTMESLYLAIRHRRSLWQATTENIEWNGESLQG